MDNKIALSSKLQSERIYLRKIRLTDANEDYCRWMNDSDVTRYIESRFFPCDINSLKKNIRQKLQDRDSVFLAIVRNDTEQHIGNIKLGPIDWTHRLADIGVLIGEKNCWGKGYATEAIGLVVKFAFRELNLHKLTAGFYAANKGSQQAFLKNGFVVEGTRAQHRLCEGRYMDTIILGLLNENGMQKKC
ncbi:MAG: GNAT family N-acetyltransferase [Syntrophaceae bacterium]|nr:GNAT family N-acetyltransferase [Syntrophaceae bacterium]